jgi:hypothetical protein
LVKKDSDLVTNLWANPESNPNILVRMLFHDLLVKQQPPTVKQSLKNVLSSQQKNTVSENDFVGSVTSMLNKNPDFREKVFSNKYFTPEFLDSLYEAKKDSPEVLNFIARHPKTSSETISKIVKQINFDSPDDNKVLISCIIQNPNTPAEIVTRINLESLEYYEIASLILHPSIQLPIKTTLLDKMFSLYKDTVEQSKSEENLGSLAILKELAQNIAIQSDTPNEIVARIIKFVQDNSGLFRSGPERDTSYENLSEMSLLESYIIKHNPNLMISPDRQVYFLKEETDPEEDYIDVINLGVSYTNNLTVPDTSDTRSYKTTLLEVIQEFVSFADTPENKILGLLAHINKQIINIKSPNSADGFSNLNDRKQLPKEEVEKYKEILLEIAKIPNLTEEIFDALMNILQEIGKKGYADMVSEIKMGLVTNFSLSKIEAKGEKFLSDLCHSLLNDIQKYFKEICAIAQNPACSEKLLEELFTHCKAENSKGFLGKILTKLDGDELTRYLLQNPKFPQRLIEQLNPDSEIFQWGIANHPNTSLPTLLKILNNTKNKNTNLALCNQLFKGRAVLWIDDFKANFKPESADY